MVFPNAWLRELGGVSIRDYIVNRNDSFGTFRTPLTDTPFNDGAIDNYGNGLPTKPAATGNLSLMVSVLPNRTDTDFQTELDLIYSIFNGERKALTYAPANTSTEDNWRRTLARGFITSATYDINRGRSALLQAQLICQDPYWYQQTGMNYLDEGFALDDGLSAGAGMTAHTGITNGSTLNITNSGNAETAPIFTIRAGAGTIANLRIDRTDATLTGRFYETIYWNSTLPANKELVIDCLHWKLHSNDVSLALLENFVWDKKQYRWLSLKPGVNRFRITGTFGANATIYSHYHHTYHN